MNNAIFALPGLMPPTSPNFHSKLVAPENGSLCLCVHCGWSGDEVHYAVCTPGPRGGVIKDPSYNYGPMPLIAEGRLKSYLATLPQFLTISETLPPDALVPRMTVNGCPVPITERPDVCNPLYWILRLPIRTLPQGDSVVEVTINGRLNRYVMQRPAFAAHALPDITSRFRGAKHQKGETLDVSIQELTPKDIILRLTNIFGENTSLLDEAEYRAFAIFGEEKINLSVEADEDVVTLHVPPLNPGKGIWRAEYRIYDDWLLLSAGDLVITQVKAAPSQTVVIPSTGSSFDLRLATCGASASMYEGAEYAAEVIVDGLSYACEVALKDAETITITVPPIAAGEGLWSVSYKLFDEWLDLSAGTIKISE